MLLLKDLRNFGGGGLGAQPLHGATNGHNLHRASPLDLSMGFGVLLEARVPVGCTQPCVGVLLAPTCSPGDPATVWSTPSFLARRAPLHDRFQLAFIIPALGYTLTNQFKLARSFQFRERGGSGGLL
jgi:hypothetical protein